MAKKINKKELLNLLRDKTNLTEEKCLSVLNIFDQYFIFDSKNKNAIVNEISSTLNLQIEESIKIYETAIEIIKSTIKEKLHHPFKSQD